jgi:RAP1 GTPase activating protein 1
LLLPSDPTFFYCDFVSSINKLESFESSRTFKWGVLNNRSDQALENEIYSNRHEDASLDYLEFLEFLGDKIELSGWKKYRGGLDTQKNTTGAHSVFTEHRGLEIMFHVATLLPFQDQDAQRVERKRHLGNDICCLVFCETDAPPFDPQILTSEFTHVVCVVSVARRDPKTDEPFYRVAFVSRAGVPPYGPFLSDPPVYRRNDPLFREFLLTKLVNGERSALYRAPVFASKLKRTRTSILTDIVESYMP